MFARCDVFLRTTIFRNWSTVQQVKSLTIQLSESLCHSAVLEWFSAIWIYRMLAGAPWDFVPSFEKGSRSPSVARVGPWTPSRTLQGMDLSQDLPGNEHWQSGPSSNGYKIDTSIGIESISVNPCWFIEVDIFRIDIISDSVSFFTCWGTTIVYIYIYNRFCLCMYGMVLQRACISKVLPTRKALSPDKSVWQKLVPLNAHLLECLSLHRFLCTGICTQSIVHCPWTHRDCLWSPRSRWITWKAFCHSRNFPRSLGHLVKLGSTAALENQFRQWAEQVASRETWQNSSLLTMAC